MVPCSLNIYALLLAFGCLALQSCSDLVWSSLLVVKCWVCSNGIWVHMYMIGHDLQIALVRLRSIFLTWRKHNVTSTVQLPAARDICTIPEQLFDVPGL